MLNSFFLDINGSLADISDFGEDIMSEAGSDSSGISPSSHDGSKNDTDIDYNTEPSIISVIYSSFMPKRVVAILYSRDSNCKAYNYDKVAGNNFWIDISAMSTNATLLNEYSFLEWTYGPELERIYMFLKWMYSLNWYNFPEGICFHWRKIFPWMNMISLNELISSLKWI